MNYSRWPDPPVREVTASELIWHYFIPWLYGKLFSLGWTFVSSMVSYSPFLLMTLIENKIEENRWKKLHQMQIRAREDYAMEELSAYKDGDDNHQYVDNPEERRTEEEDNTESRKKQ